MINTYAISTNFSCHVTILSKTSIYYSLFAKNNVNGSFNPSNLEAIITPYSQISFSPIGDINSIGSSGTATYQTSTSKHITFAFACPLITDNSLSIPLDQTEYDIIYYGRNQYTNWDLSGTNWGQPNNFPTRGYPLYALFVINQV